MEFNEKLQELRTQKGLTQQELAERLYVSRAAVSKWESGRGYPNIDSLKSIARFFSVTVDDLLSTEDALIIAEENKKQDEKHFRNTVFGISDICMALLLFLPLFASKADGVVREASLVNLEGVGVYLKIVYFTVVIAASLVGVITLALQNLSFSLWNRTKAKVSLAIGIAAVLLFMISSQPYASVFAFSMLIIKGAVLINRR